MMVKTATTKTESQTESPTVDAVDKENSLCSSSKNKTPGRGSCSSSGSSNSKGQPPKQRDPFVKIEPGPREDSNNKIRKPVEIAAVVLLKEAVVATN